MTREETINVLQSIEDRATDFPHMTACDWVAIAAAKRHLENSLEVEELWKPADGDDIPEIDREVVVLYQRYPLEGNEYAVGFAHRPKEFWDGKNIATGKVTRYYPKRYDKGGWNSPDIKWWLDLDLPKTEE